MADWSNDIDRYRKNQMTDAERHALEKRALEDPFLADALEGAETLDPQQFRADVVNLDKQLQPVQQPRYVFALRIAAGLAIVVTTGWLFWSTETDAPTPETMMAKNDSTADAGTGGDTTKQLLTLAAPEKTADVKKESPAKSPSTSPSSTATTAGPTVSQPKPTIEVAADAVKTEEAATREVAAKDDLAVATTTPASDALKLAETERTAAAQAPAGVTMREEVKPHSEIQVLPSGLTDESNRRKAAGESKRSSALSTVLATPVGGLEAYQRYLEQNQRIPEAARAANVHGQVTVSFIVDTNGLHKEFAVLKGIGSGCEEELIRLIKEGPAWSPSKEGANPVPSTVHISLNF